MAGKKISQLTKLTELTGTEIIPVAKDGQNYGVETLALLGISVYDIPDPLDDNYIYTPEQLAEIKKSIEDGKIIRFGGWSMPTVYFLEDDGEMVFDIDNGGWSRVIFTIKANGEWEINPPVDFFNYVVEMPNIVEGEELTGTLPAETFGDLLERLKRSGNVMFRYPQAGSSNPVNQYDIGISIRYSQTNITIIHAEGTRELSIIPSGNYTDRPVVSKQYQLITTRLNDYMYDMSGLLGKLAYKGMFHSLLDQFTLEGYYDVNGELREGGEAISTPKMDIIDGAVYHLELLATYSYIYPLNLYDNNGKLLYNSINPQRQVEKDYIFAGASKISLTIRKSQASISTVGYYDLQDTSIEGNRALYVAAGAVYNQNTGFYELNGLTDITEEQMKVIYVQTNHMDCIENMNDVFSGLNFRTNLGFRHLRRTNGRAFSLKNAFRENANLEVLRLGNSTNDNWVIKCSDMQDFVTYCSNLKEIIGYIECPVAVNFLRTPLLEEIRFKNIARSFGIKDSPLISLESLQYLITNAANTSPITVTVHADVYAKIQDETNAEWHALIETAAAKQITFATA